tara:strand:- start:105 stop:671 length:567 start_codon:yes stop_codon:yes gene_type:complete
MPTFYTPYGKFESNQFKDALMNQIQGLIKSPDEDVLYFHKHASQFMNCRWSDEHLPELHKWKEQNLHSYQCNRKEIQVGRHKVFANVYQPEGDDASMSILSMGLGTMVDGITYIYKKKIHADAAHKMLEKQFVETGEQLHIFGKPEHDDPENATEPSKWTLDLKERTYPKKRTSKKKKKKGKKGKKKK